jgi:hypothetical protein
MFLFSPPNGTLLIVFSESAQMSIGRSLPFWLVIDLCQRQFLAGFIHYPGYGEMDGRAAWRVLLLSVFLGANPTFSTYTYERNCLLLRE